jgi:diketogulonate reductase-like aldo/keto reductase
VHWPPSRPQAVRQLWNELRQIRDEGLTRAIGVSNYDLLMIDDLIEDSGEAPAVNQIRWSPSRYDADVVVGHKARGIVLEGYSPLRDKSLRDPLVAQIAAAHEVTPAQVILRWHIEHGTPVIPKSERPERIAANIDLFGFTLSQDEVSQIDELSG